ncbi:MAG: multiubiquitin domain-containing protein [Flavisolibacter sp.]
MKQELKTQQSGNEVVKPHDKHEPKYKVMVDRSVFDAPKECMTGREILALAQKSPVERFQLNVRMHGGKVSKVGYDETICFSTPGIEKFMTIPLDQTEGGN